ncbi:mit domain-containing 1 [Brachionus plicatilis]|uniref:Mit domain-containing 1 n=1 Tax=Brachionus plicatilis TaxID=10195 RepID=A0A3M7R8L9_BRAPC|nr:mit domain-containing 1 [Brachionus plicatilis]
MLVKLTKNIKKITLTTTKDEDSHNQQESRLGEIGESLNRRNTKLIINYNNALHDREIRFSTGWIVKIGRGLDYFKPPECRDKLCIGFHDLDLRSCYATTVDIFHSKSTIIRK